MPASARLYPILEEEIARNPHQEAILFLAKYVLGWNVKVGPMGMVFEKPFGKISALKWDPFENDQDYEEALQGFSRNPIWCLDYAEKYAYSPEEESDHAQCLMRMVEFIQGLREAMEKLKAG